MINKFVPLTANFKAPKVGVSACLLGEKVRYDGQDKNSSAHLDPIIKHCQIQAICPEVSAGLGVPRPPVQLAQSERGIEAIGVKQKDVNVTDALQEQAELLEKMPVQGFILKSRSPSCGINSTPIYNRQGEPESLGSGIIAARLQKAGRVLIDELQLQQPDICQAFIKTLLLLEDLQQYRGPEEAFISHHSLACVACNKAALQTQIIQQFYATTKGQNHV